jgi:hypothetical protein
VSYQKQDVAYERFRRDIEDLVAAIRAVRKPVRSARSWPWRPIAAGVIGVVAIAGLGAYFVGIPLTGLRPATRVVTTREKVERVGQQFGTDVKRTFHSLRERWDRQKVEAARSDPALAIAPGSDQSFRDDLASGGTCAICPEMAPVPAGSFVMGSPSDEAAVEIPAKFRFR